MFSIKKNGDTTYSLFIDNHLYRNDFYEFFILTNNLPLAFINEEKLFFQAERVCLLEDLLKNQHYKLNQIQCLHMIKSISYQIKYFEEKGITFLGFDIKDIIVINDNGINDNGINDNGINDNGINDNGINDYKFFIMGTRFAIRFHSYFINLFVPYEKPYFSSPEIINVIKLPYKVHYKSCYYSLGALTVFCLLNEYLLKGNEVSDVERIEHILNPIYLSKMYWFLIRCLNENVEERVLLYI